MAVDRDELLALATRTKRALSQKHLEVYYSPEELENLVQSYESKPNVAVSSLRWGDRYDKLTGKIKYGNKRFDHIWTPEEDEFLRMTYQHLTINTMALALNLPWQAVVYRRKALNLTRVQQRPMDVMIWCERDNFERDIKTSGFMKARPDALRFDNKNKEILEELDITAEEVLDG